MKNFLKLFKKLLPIILIAFAIFLFFWKVFLKGQVPIPADFVVGVYYPWLDYKWGFSVGVPVKNPITTDVVSFTYPMQMLAIKLLKTGQFPLWNPYILGGNPLLANFQSSPYAITNFVYFIFDQLTAWSIQIVLQHVLAAIFTFFLLRHWKVSKLGSALGAIIYTFSGFNTIWSEWNGHTLTAAFIPLVILFSDKWLLEGKALYGFLDSIALALLFLSGYPQIALYLLVALGILWFFRLELKWSFFFKTILLGVFLALGLALSAFQILPGGELLNSSQRAVEYHPFEWAFLPWSKAITFIAPDFFGNHATKNYWGPQDYTSNTGFVGVIAFSLLFLGLSFFKKIKEVRFASVLLSASLILSYPTFIAIFLWKSGILGLNAASAHRALVIFNLSVAILAAYGFDYLKKAKGKVSFKFLIPTFLLLFGYGLYALISKLNPSIPQIIKEIPAYTVALRNLIFPTFIFAIFIVLILLIRILKTKNLFLIAIILLLSYELARFGWKFTPFSLRSMVFPQTPVLEFLESQEKPFRVTGNKVTPMNMRMVYDLESPEGYDAVYPVWIAKLLATLNDANSSATFTGRYGFVDREDSPFLDLMNTKYVLALKQTPKGDPNINGKVAKIYQNPKFKKVFEDKTVEVLENTNALPRAFMVYDWESDKVGTEILDALLVKDFPYQKKIFVEGYNSEPAKVGTYQVEYQEYLENRSKLKVKTTVPGLLFISDTYYPGWKAYLDGKETTIFKADYAFRAIEVPEGEHLIKFEYRPDSFFNGLKISLVSLIILSLLSVVLMIIGKGKLGRYTLKS